MARIVLDNLRKEYGDLVAVNDMSLEIKDGEFVALLGPSGCGKSTTLKMVVGLEMPTRGRLLIDDVVVNDKTPKERNIGIVFQEYAIFPHMSPYDNIAFGLRVKKMPEAEIKKEVDRVSEILDLGEILQKKTRKLNVGELQRVAIGRTIVTQPAIVLLDEPLSNLEAALRARTRAELKKLQRDLKQTTIYVTHDQVEAMSLADRIAVMSRGVLQQYDSPEVIYNQPQNRFVGNFIGSPPMNFMECALDKQNGKIFLDQGGFKLDVTDWRDLLEQHATSSDLLFGVRPEHIHVNDSSGDGEWFKGQIYAVEPLGSETILDVKMGDAMIRAMVHAAYQAQVGADVWVEFDRTKIHVLDKRTSSTIV
ncbi:MAG: ABC transporter ATP-binding protein [Chloroflexi bacterium]|nr:ABC transporter ATP-binding protein [Chloroflexota bacterium]